MPGPKSPHGYAETFHQTLAQIQTDQPEQVRIRSTTHPSRLRALFNQFRSAWMREADKLRKQKDFKAANLAQEKYEALLPYSCTLADDGIILTHQRTSLDKIETYGRVTIPQVEIPEEPSIQDSWKEIARKQEEQVRAILKLGPVISRNPPTNTDEN